MNAVRGFDEWVTPLRRFAFALQGERWALGCAALCIVGVVASNTALIFLIGRPVEDLAAGRWGEVGTALLTLLGVVLINQGFHFIGTVNAQALGLRFLGRVRNRALQRLLQAGFTALEEVPRGDILARLAHDTDQVEALVVETPLWLLSHLLTLATYVVMLFLLDADLALSALLLVPAFALHQWLFAGRKRRAAAVFLQANGRLAAFEEGVVNHLRGINGLAAESAVEERHRMVFERARRAALHERRLDAAFAATLSLLVYGGGLLVFWWGMARVAQGDLGLGGLTSFLLFLGYLAVPLRGLTQLPFQAQTGAAAAQRVGALLELRPPVPVLAEAPPLRVRRGGIRLHRVHHAFPGGGTVLDGVDLDIEPGEVLAIVGPSGTGKSTLAQLLARYRDPQEGWIGIDGQELRSVSLESVRAQVGVMWQDPLLLGDTVRANLLLARPDADEAALREALQAAQAWDFVRALPHGLDTPVGSGGVTLSGGQVQRLGLARMFLHDPPILILDEATAALDSDSERRVLEALLHRRAGRTTILIAHRIAAIRVAHRIAYLEGGRLWCDRHEALLARHPGYRKAVEWQTRETSPSIAGS